MRLVTETTEEKQKILIVSKKNYSFISFLKLHLKKYQTEVFFSPQLPKSLSLFDYCLLINEDINLDLLLRINFKKIILIFVGKQNQAKQFLENIPRKKNIKIIEIKGDLIKENDIDRLLWFALSTTNEKYLKLFVPRISKLKEASHQMWWQKIKFLFTPQRVVLFFICFFILIHFLFIPLLFTSIVLTYQAYLNLKSGSFKNFYNYLAISNFLLNKSKDTYRIVRPTYLFFSAALLPDNLIDITERIQNIFSSLHQLNINIKQIWQLIFKKDKTEEEKLTLNLRIEKLKEEIDRLDENLKTLNPKIPSQIKALQTAKNYISEAADGVDKMKRILAHLDIIFGKEKELKYLIFFANNRELRPGGGFLGSFGIVKVKEYTVEDIKIYDVYDTDGQLKIHVEPPEAIRKYLHLPHWYLRDSNFSPDFLDNYLRAKFFLDKQIKISNFDGAILFTTTSIEEILTAFGSIYLPDFNEYINSKNFYLKTQIHSEKGFFPGSIQKKTFLSTLIRQIIINFDNASIIKLVSAIKKSLDEKQIVIYFDEPKVQTFFDLWYWSGRVIKPKCHPSEKCLIDYLFPYDANLGSNKANFFINRSFIFKTNFDSQGFVHHLFSVKYENNSPGEVFPGGVYRNFFQIILPKDIILKKITKDGIIIDEFMEQQHNTLFKNIGFYFEVPPKKTVEIKIEYQLLSKLEKGKQLYQLIIQKQIGSFNSDLVLETSFSKNIHLINQNFSPLVSKGKILYNTNLNTDKLFFIELTLD